MLRLFRDSLSALLFGRVSNVFASISRRSQADYQKAINRSDQGAFILRSVYVEERPGETREGVRVFWLGNVKANWPSRDPELISLALSFSFFLLSSRVRAHPPATVFTTVL